MCPPSPLGVVSGPRLLLAALLATLILPAARATTYYVAPDGSDTAAGTIGAPFGSLQRAQQSVTAGDTVYLRGGTYAITEAQIAQRYSIWAYVNLLSKSGAPTARITYSAYPGEHPVLDFSAVKPADLRVTAFYVTGSWLHLRGLEVTGVQVTILTHTQSICFDNEGSHNVYEQLVMHDGQAIGLWIGKGSDNLVLNCDAYRNWDYTSEDGKGGNVDGFGFHAGKGSTGNVYRGCRAWFNSDDGFDCLGAGEGVLWEDCWSFYNGYNSSFAHLGDGNGFKAGGYGDTAVDRLPDPIPRHTVLGCLAVHNKASGVYANHHIGGDDFIGNTAWGNGTNYNFLCRLADNVTDVPGYGHLIRNNLSYGGAAQPSNLDTSACTLGVNSFNATVTVSSADFLGVSEANLTAPRQANGELPVVPLLHLVEGSDLVDKGTDVGRPYAGTAPDLGVFESDLIPVANQSFEYPVVTTTIPATAGAVWTGTPATASGGAGLCLATAGIAAANGAAPDGKQVAYVQGTGTLSLALAGLGPGHIYLLRFKAAQRALSGAAGQTWDITLDGSVVRSFAPPASATAYTEYDVLLDATAASQVLAFVGTDLHGGSNTVLLDDVRITLLTVASDADTDGLPDVWEVGTLGTLAYGPDSDPDGDGTPNRIELLLGLDPSSPMQAFAGSVSRDGSGGIEITWPSRPGVAFTVERSTNLTAWQGIANVAGPSGQTVAHYVDAAPPAPLAYYRVSTP